MDNDDQKTESKMYFLNKPEPATPRVIRIVEMEELTFILATEKAELKSATDHDNGRKVHTYTQDLGDGWSANYSIKEDKRSGRNEAFVELKLGSKTVESKIVPLDRCDFSEPKAGRA